MSDFQTTDIQTKDVRKQTADNRYQTKDSRQQRKDKRLLGEAFILNSGY
jgi:hypothetical protein